ncbi:hypothetical protein K523DRAFT_104238 [Schizophyllum commune Tattone D]|nr:hypothetical protein K523DRAFT_104238 [Schizophyllum commune Tattone D]
MRPMQTRGCSNYLRSKIALHSTPNEAGISELSLAILPFLRLSLTYEMHLASSPSQFEADLIEREEIIRHPYAISLFPDVLPAPESGSPELCCSRPQK